MMQYNEMNNKHGRSSFSLNPIINSAEAAIHNTYNNSTETVIESNDDINNTAETVIRNLLNAENNSSQKLTNIAIKEVAPQNYELNVPSENNTPTVENLTDNIRVVTNELPNLSTIDTIKTFPRSNDDIKEISNSDDTILNSIPHTNIDSRNHSIDTTEHLTPIVICAEKIIQKILNNNSDIIGVEDIELQMVNTENVQNKSYFQSPHSRDNFDSINDGVIKNVRKYSENDNAFNSTVIRNNNNIVEQNNNNNVEQNNNYVEQNNNNGDVKRNNGDGNNNIHNSDDNGNRTNNIKAFIGDITKTSEEAVRILDNKTTKENVINKNESIDKKSTYNGENKQNAAITALKMINGAEYDSSKDSDTILAENGGNENGGIENGDIEKKNTRYIDDIIHAAETAIKSLNIENRDIENRDIENRDIENRDIENRDIENRDIENRDIENRDIENRDIENEDIENEDNEDIENGSIENEDIENGSIENEDIDNGGIEKENTRYIDDIIHAAETAIKSLNIENRDIENEDNEDIENEDNENEDNEDIENGSIENGSIENGSIENGSIENGSIENEGIDNGGIENGGIEKKNTRYIDDIIHAAETAIKSLNIENRYIEIGNIDDIIYTAETALKTVNIEGDDIEGDGIEGDGIEDKEIENVDYPENIIHTAETAVKTLNIDGDEFVNINDIIYTAETALKTFIDKVIENAKDIGNLINDTTSTISTTNDPTANVDDIVSIDTSLNKKMNHDASITIYDVDNDNIENSKVIKKTFLTIDPTESKRFILEDL